MGNNSGRTVGAFAGAGISFFAVTVLATVTFALGIVVSLFGLLSSWHTAVFILAVTILVVVLEFVIGVIAGAMLGRKVGALDDAKDSADGPAPDHSAGIYPPRADR